MKTQTEIVIPAEAVELSHIQTGEHVAVRIGENTLVALPEKLTAMQAVNAIGTLAELNTELIIALKDACGTCADHMKQGGCPFGGTGGPDECPYQDISGPEVEVNALARRAMGIPLDAKVMLHPGEGEGLVTAADYEHDITDVPEEIRILLKAVGVCPGRLDELLMSEDIIDEA